MLGIFVGFTPHFSFPRLISERTVEENILKKANQKRMLGDMAIEGGNFTTAYFKQVPNKILLSKQKRTFVVKRVPYLLDSCCLYFHRFFCIGSSSHTSTLKVSGLEVIFHWLTSPLCYI
jgi:hypothetical protein